MGVQPPRPSEPLPESPVLPVPAAHHGGSRGGNCILCRHPERHALDAALTAGTDTWRQLATKYAVPARSCSYHRTRCLHLASLSKKESGQKSSVTRPCRACLHPEVLSLNIDIRHHVSFATVGRRYRLSVTLLKCHRTRCLGIQPQLRARRAAPLGPIHAELARVVEALRHVEQQCETLRQTRIRYDTQIRLLTHYLALQDGADNSTKKALQSSLTCSIHSYNS